MRMIACFSHFPPVSLVREFPKCSKSLLWCSQNRAWKINNIFHLETHTCFLVETRLTIDPIFHHFSMARRLDGKFFREISDVKSARPTPQRFTLTLQRPTWQRVCLTGLGREQEGPVGWWRVEVSWWMKGLSVEDVGWHAKKGRVHDDQFGNTEFFGLEGLSLKRHTQRWRIQSSGFCVQVLGIWVRSYRNRRILYQLPKCIERHQKVKSISLRNISFFSKYNWVMYHH